MQTFIYMVRHGDSPKNGNERTRGLTEKGYLDAQRVTALLADEGIDIVASSPYTRSILTVNEIALHINKEVLVYEGLKERKFSAEENRVGDKELIPLLEKSFRDASFTLKGAESNADCQKRAVSVLLELLETFQGKKVVIGTHGAVMTLMMGYFDRSYGLEFLHSTTKPDVYKLEFKEQELISVQRLCT
ncbi:2,3-bisphosphoglycerate-dependent phosphoglycerate mutase [Terribacillus aidingensis]|uniref:2,3-bisphosphoglycerate-dependent phosphoglycerate mutase n=1 Tax=Terribacillus aidingensis TaxID=586416 RepID=A0A285NKR0_9BACI|nr:histidine phosphatase family protein [Terribacillus aidingensis]SNZ10114.1 2,3-bisphosphoglycerate-dependent phosphoglycerate mutase [Terribacillus aidingensis]